jgi:hypothetical protein
MNKEMSEAFKEWCDTSTDDPRLKSKCAFEAGVKWAREQDAKICIDNANKYQFTQANEGLIVGSESCAKAIRNQGDKDE